MNLDVVLSWKRIKKDFKDKNFIYPLLLPNILQNDLDKWLQILKEKFDKTNYFPHPMEIVEIPKGNGLIRPGSLLTIEDNLYYSCLVQECYPTIFDNVKWSQNVKDFAFIADFEHLNLPEWYKNPYEGWKRFRDKSIELIKTGYQYVILTDITGFYENIDINLIISDLRELNIDQTIINQISQCLNRWSKVGSKGIPQGNSASDLLAKVYLDPVDRGLDNAGFIHLRYVDDIRIFCKNIDEARRALIELTRLLRKRGLNLQSAKTKILQAKHAEVEIEGVQSVITMIADKIREDAIFTFENFESYEETDVDDQDESKDETPIQIIKETFKAYFIEANSEKFDKTLFHYLINRFINDENDFALDYCLSILDKHPEETKFILGYLNTFDDFSEFLFGTQTIIHMKLTQFISSKDYVYDYQIYLILEWFYQRNCLVQETC